MNKRQKKNPEMQLNKEENEKEKRNLLLDAQLLLDVSLTIFNY